MKQRSRTEYSLINMFTGFIGYGLNTIIGFVCRIIFVKTLSAEYLGLSGLFTNVLSVLSLAELGISSAIIYALYKPIAEKDHKKIASIMKFYRKAYAVIGIFVGIVGLAIMPFLNYLIKEPPAIKESIYLLYGLYLLNTTISYFFSYRASLLTAMQRQYIVSGYNYVITIIQSILQTIFLLATKEYIWYLLIQIAGGIGYNVWISHKASKDYPYILAKDIEPLEKAEAKSLFINIKALAINKISGVLVNSTDNMAISFFSGISLVGYTSNYILFSSTVGTLIGQVFNALPGSVGNLNATTDDEGRYKFFKVLNLANFWLFGWGAIGIALCSSDLVKLFYGAEYVLPMRIPLIIAINSFTIGMLQACYTYKSTLGLFRYGQYLLFFTGIINLIFDIILGKIWGVFGIYVATLIARVCTNLWYEPYAIYKYGLMKNPVLYLKRYCYFLFVILLGGGISGILCSWCSFSVVGNVLAKILICTVIPNIVFVLAFKETEEFNYLRTSGLRIIRKLFKK